jgi:release factor glutamine methyltransferase
LLDAETLYDRYLLQLEPLYGSREAQSMLLILWEDILGFPRGQKRGAISLGKGEVLATAIERIQSGEPLQYVVGFTYFLGLKIYVSPAVLIPRPETEELVLWAIDTLEEKGIPLGNLIDLGTGSGCIPIALKYRLPDWGCAGMDISEEALHIAEQNATENKTEVDFWQGDLLQLPSERLANFEVWVSNPPYIAREEFKKLPQNVRQHEPGAALFVTNDDPLQFYRTIARLASQQKKGTLRYIFLECHESYAEEVKSLFSQLPQTDSVTLKQDFQGKPRMVKVSLTS